MDSNGIIKTPIVVTSINGTINSINIITGSISVMMDTLNNNKNKENFLMLKISLL